MLRAAHSTLVLLLSGWLAVVSAGEPELFVQVASHLAGVDLDGPDSSTPDNDDEADAELAGVPAQPACRRAVIADLPAASPLSFSNSLAPARPDSPLSANFVPASHIGAGVFLRC